MVAELNDIALTSVSTPYFSKDFIQAESIYWFGHLFSGLTITVSKVFGSGFFEYSFNELLPLIPGPLSRSLISTILLEPKRSKFEELEVRKSQLVRASTI